MSDRNANQFPDSEICEACEQRHPIGEMHLTDDPCWLCKSCWAQAIESQGPVLDDGHDDGEYCGDGWCSECSDPFHLDDVGGYNPPCSCDMHCRSCHDAIERDDDDDDYDERDAYPDTAEEVEQAMDRFWDGRVGHSANATDDDELPF